MNWYDVISPLYDLGATGSGRVRREAVTELRLKAGDAVLDIACGTGLNFPLIQAGIGPEGLLIGLDFSAGMLAKARPRVRRQGWDNVHLIEADARTLSKELLREHAGIDRVDRVLCTLGFTVVPDWEAVFQRSCALLRRGGRYAIMDWHVPRRNLFSWFLNSISQGDVSRKTWSLLEENVEDYRYRTFIGGNVFVAAGTSHGALGESSGEGARELREVTHGNYN